MALNTNLKSLAPARDRLKLKTPLVSGGYSVRELLPDAHITVFPWDTSVSEWLARQNMDAKGETHVMVELVRRVTGLQDAILNQLPEGELPMILMVSRALAFNEQRLTFMPRCSHCGRLQKEASVRIPDDLEVLGQKPADYPGYEPAFTLQISKDELVIRPLLVSDILSIERQQMSTDPLFTRTSEPIMRLATCLVSVGGGKPENIRESLSYVQALHPVDVEHFTNKIVEISPGLSQNVKCKCDFEDCAKEFKFTLNLRRDFFRQAGA
jgi:hypothetical protein